MKVVYNILAAGIWAPPAKLVFGVYLTHICVLDVYLYSREAAIFWNMEYIVLTTTFIACIAFTISLAVTLLVESPVMGLERVLRGGSNWILYFNNVIS